MLSAMVEFNIIHQVAEWVERIGVMGICYGNRTFSTAGHPIPYYIASIAEAVMFRLGLLHHQATSVECVSFIASHWGSSTWLDCYQRLERTTHSSNIINASPGLLPLQGTWWQCLRTSATRSKKNRSLKNYRNVSFSVSKCWQSLIDHGGILHQNDMPLMTTQPELTSVF